MRLRLPRGSVRQPEPARCREWRSHRRCGPYSPDAGLRRPAGPKVLRRLNRRSEWPATGRPRCRLHRARIAPLAGRPKSAARGAPGATMRRAAPHQARPGLIRPRHWPRKPQAGHGGHRVWCWRSTPSPPSATARGHPVHRAAQMTTSRLRRIPSGQDMPAR